jgi:outer membrane receptor protein involved in Fe transport
MLLAAAPGPTPAEAEQPQLSEIVVTASRRGQLRSEFPGSISRLEGVTLEMLGATHSSEALNRVAGVNIQRGSGQESLIAIRSPVLTGAGACGAFLLLEDGMPLRPTGFCNLNALFEANTEQAAAIEVIRGPATATYGASAVHGIVNVLTPAAADLANWRIAVEGGSDAYRRVRLASGARLGAAQLGAYALLTRDGGFRDQSGVDEAKLNLLADLEVAGGDLRLRLAGTVLNQETAGFIRGLDAYRNPALRISNPNPEAYRDAWSTRLSATWMRERCEGCVTDLRGVLRHSQMQFSQHFLLGKPIEENGQVSFALSASQRYPLTPALTLRAGADLERADTELLEVQSGPTLEGGAAARAIRPAGRHYDYAVASLGIGAFAQLDWQIAQRWQLGAALRADRTHYRYDNRMIDGNTDEQGRPCGAGGCLYSRPADRSDSFDNFGPKLDLRWQLSAAQALYVAATRGYRPPEMTELYRLQRQQSIADLQSERLDSLEIGWSGRSQRWRADLAAFAMTKDQVILRDANALNVSGGRTRHHGIEYEIGWQALPALELRASGTLARHRYAFTRTIEGGEMIVDGNEVDTAPHALANLQLLWKPSNNAATELEIVHVGAHFIDASNLRRYPGHTLANLRLRWVPRPAWSATLRVTNLFDVAYADRADFAQGEYRYFPGRGRSFFLELQWQRAQ